MDWLRMHPYMEVGIGIAFILGIGALVVSTRTATEPRGGSQTWSGVSGVLSNPNYEGGVVPAGTSESRGQSIFEQVQSGAPFTYSSPVMPSHTDLSELVPTSGDEEADIFDFEAFLALLGEGSTSVTTDVSNVDEGTGIAFEFLPQGFISTSSAPSVERTEAQSALFDYGNELGSSIEAFEALYPNQTEVFTDSLEDRGNADKTAAVERIARGMMELGASLGNLDPVPTTVAGVHKKLVSSYRAMGEKLLVVPRAADDNALLEAINAYNASVDDYIENYIAVATLFSSFGVTFGTDDPGSIFTFTAASF